MNFEIIIEIRPNQLVSLDTEPVVVIPVDRPVEVTGGEIIWRPEESSPTSNAKVTVEQGNKTLFTSGNVFNDKETDEKIGGGHNKEQVPVVVTVNKSIADLRGNLVVDLTFEDDA